MCISSDELDTSFIIPSESADTSSTFKPNFQGFTALQDSTSGDCESSQKQIQVARADNVSSVKKAKPKSCKKLPQVKKTSPSIVHSGQLVKKGYFTRHKA